MKRVVGFCLLAGLFACTGKGHFLSDAEYRAEVERDFEAKREALPAGDLFGVFDVPMTTEEREAMMFLYAYMPVGDVTDYEGAFYLENVRRTFATREEMPWGKGIPEGIFRHFVLPLRVNNEALDESRGVFFEELKERVRGLSLHDAVLEVNHWCHEKVIYTPSDGRTSSALASVRTAYGRCGEESTFTVAALRAVGIPARQVYTPRWAHTDDNHAWVEAWTDGEWRFMGACEPEPVLNLGWFNGPAYRGMLMHTRVFGNYYGPEEVMERTAAFTEINVIDNYAPVGKAFVQVTDAEGHPVEGAGVEFKIYNYAEYYTVANKTTDAAGECFLSAGRGDMLVWAVKDGMFGYGKVSFGEDTRVTIRLDRRPGDTEIVDFDIVPPVEGSVTVEVTDAQREENTRRMQEEDNIRNNYTSTFYTTAKAAALAATLGIDSAETVKFMLGSRGNYAEIEKFLRETPEEKLATAMSLLRVVSAKDLRDTPASVLADHLNNTPETDSEHFERYILNPRIGNELLSPYKGQFASFLDAKTMEAVQNDPVLLVDWVRQHITVNEGLNPQRIPVSPAGVYKARTADKGSRDIFFIAAARTMGIAARFDPVARKVQYHSGMEWTDVNFDSEVQPVTRQGKVTASFKPVKSIDDPKYYSHFTVAKIGADGRLQTLQLERTNSVDMGAGDAWSGLLKKPLAIDEGHYVLVTGMRMADGSVLSEMTFFNVEAEQTTGIELVMRESNEGIAVIGSFNSEDKFRRADTGEETSVLATTGRGYFVVGILGARQEPTNHALRDIAAVKDDLEAWGKKIVLLFPDEQRYSRFDAGEFGTLPNTIVYGIDGSGTIQKEIAEAMKLANPDTLPVFIVADTFNRVVFVSHGYTIGLGEQLMKVIRKL
ncbi:Alpha-L-fucosidase [Bacteroidales bacterium Barb6XT]|nr:Alpha-L-fucosidase [Bacteroidales bacterium Barb6XT]